jgi:predicted nucleic acid-binding protein
MLPVIADTSPIRYLVQIGHIDPLHSLFETVSLPTEVAHELGEPSAPLAVRA